MKRINVLLLSGVCRDEPELLSNVRLIYMTKAHPRIYDTRSLIKVRGAQAFPRPHCFIGYPCRPNNFLCLARGEKTRPV